MTKKKVAREEPKVSNIPLPASDTPLVIDLPDGQKLVIGKLEKGSVIEVATWRGTGRPDSRTNRLMLGMSSGSDSNEGKSSETHAARTTSGNKYIALSLKYLNQIRATIQRIDFKGLFSRVRNAPKVIREKTPRGEKFEPIELTRNVEIDEWLSKITRNVEEKSAKKRTAKKKL